MEQEYIVSARKYRPTTFESVVGQKALVQTLKNSILSGKLAHAYLFCGPRGVGKTTCARIFAKTINCRHLTASGDACNECEACQAFNEQRSLNIHELDAASNNSVDNIRELIDQVQVPPQVGRYKVFIIDEVHMLSTAAFNAFLKTLEEPPAHAIFIMATTEKQKILPTILSRCQIYDFQRISVQDIADHLAYVASQEHIDVEPAALQVIARKSDGGMRDALSVFDQIASFTGGHVTYQATIDDLNILDYELFFRLTDAALAGNVPAALLMLDEVIRRGFDAQSFISGWASHLRDLMMSKDAATAALIEAGQDVAMRYQQQAAGCDLAFLYAALQVANDCDFNYRNSRNKRLAVEIAIIRICQLTQTAAAAPRPTQQPLRPVSAPPSPQSQQAAPLRPAAPSAQPYASSSQAYAPQSGVATPQVVRQPAPAYQAAAAPQPVSPQPVQSVAPRVVTRATPMAGMSSLRTTSMRATPAQHAAAVAAARPPLDQNEPVTDEALRRTWKDYVSTIPTEHFLVNSMLGCLPQLVEGTRFEVTVMNQEQKDRLDAKHEAIMSFLQSRLHNTHLQMVVTQAAADGPHRAYTPREKFGEMRDDNPVLNDFVEVFGLEFS